MSNRQNQTNDENRTSGAATPLQQGAIGGSTMQHIQRITGSAPGHSQLNHPATPQSATAGNQRALMCPINPGCQYDNQGLSPRDALASHLFNNHGIHNHATSMANLVAALDVQQGTVDDLTRRLQWERAVKAEVNVDLESEKAESQRLHNEVMQLRIQLAEERAARAPAEARAARESYEQGYERGFADGLAQGSDREE